MTRDACAIRNAVIWQVVLSVATGVEPQNCLLQANTNLHRRLVGSPDTIVLKVGNASTGLNMPLMGFGTCCRDSAKGLPLKKSIAAYLKHGGRLIDTAIMYENHKDVGDALETAFQSGQIVRENLWVTSKIHPDQASTEVDAISMVEKSLQDLKLDHVDLFLIHSPGPNSLAIWRALIKAKAEGKTKAIGVSNFSPEEIQELEAAGLERPSVNQIQFHPWVDADAPQGPWGLWGKGQSTFANVAWCQSHGVAITAFGSLGSNYHKGLEDKKVQELALKYSKTPAQVLLSWALRQGVAVVPGATSEEHIAQNLQAGSVKLDDEEASTHYFSPR